MSWLKSIWKKYPALLSSFSAAGLTLYAQLQLIHPLTWQAAIAPAIVALAGVLTHSQVSSPATVEQILSDAAVATQVGETLDTALKPYGDAISAAIAQAVAQQKTQTTIIRGN